MLLNRNEKCIDAISLKLDIQNDQRSYTVDITVELMQLFSSIWKYMLKTV